LDRRAGGPLDFPLLLPAHLRVVHIVGFPLACHLTSRLARRSYRRLAPLGPNDGGGILLGDVTRLPGLIYPVWGADHYMRPAWDVCSLIGRIVQRMVEGTLLPTASAGSCNTNPKRQRGSSQTIRHPAESRTLI